MKTKNISQYHTYATYQKSLHFWSTNHYSQLITDV